MLVCNIIITKNITVHFTLPSRLHPLSQTVESFNFFLFRFLAFLLFRKDSHLDHNDYINISLILHSVRFSKCKAQLLLSCPIGQVTYCPRCVQLSFRCKFSNRLKIGAHRVPCVGFSFIFLKILHAHVHERVYARAHVRTYRQTNLTRARACAFVP